MISTHSNTPGWLVWLLAGALTASLGWNVLQAARGDRPALTAGRLGLSTEQVDALEACCADCWGPSEAIRADIAEEEQALQDAWAAAERDEAEISRRIDRIGALRRELYEASVAASMRVREVLTAEQVETLRECCCGPVRD